MPAYIEWLRAKIGHRKTLVAYATAIIRNGRGRILFQRRSDFAWWGLPGGVLEIGETLAEGCRREAFEETGLMVEPVKLVGVYTGPQYDVRYPNGDEVQQWTAAFECRITGGQSRADGDEITQVAFFDPASLPPLPPWYADMVRDALAEIEAAAFEPPRVQPPAGHGDYILSLRALVGQEYLIAPGAGAYIRDEAGRVLLVQRADDGHWHLPSGFMDLGESAAETIVREVREETGLMVRPVRLVGAFSGPEYQITYPNGDPVQVCSTVFECSILGGAPRPAEVEITAAAYFPPDALPEALPTRLRQRLMEARANLPRAVFR